VHYGKPVGEIGFNIRTSVCIIEVKPMEPEEFIALYCVLALGAFPVTIFLCRFWLMSKSSQRWLAVALIVAAISVIFASTNLVDVPGPMEPSKPEFIVEFSTPLFILAVVLASFGMGFFSLSRKRENENIAAD
jgi:hypothetical protein